MADKELRRLKRRELLQMLITQCEETERLQRELDQISTRMEVMEESYERLKTKLTIKDARLNEKDARIEELNRTIEETGRSREIELTEAGSIAEASLRLNRVFEAAQQAADQYLENAMRLADAKAAAYKKPEPPTPPEGFPRSELKKRVRPTSPVTIVRVNTEEKNKMSEHGRDRIPEENTLMDDDRPPEANARMDKGQNVQRKYWHG